MLKNFLLVGFGGAIGSMLRYGASLLANFTYFPYATLAVNIIGSFIIGLVLGLSLREEYFLHNWKLFLATGICGGFTTFSSFSAENLELFQTGRSTLALVYIVGSVISGIIAVWLGYKLINVQL
jgi:CrcB protein